MKGLSKSQYISNYKNLFLSNELVKVELPLVIQPLLTRLIKANFCFHLFHRRSTTVSLETRNP